VVSHNLRRITLIARQEDMLIRHIHLWPATVLFAVLLSVGCAGKPPVEPIAEPAQYRIGPGDSLQIFVWRNPELSVTVPVRPDGKISTPLVEGMVAAGKTPIQLARDMEKVMADYIKSPRVNVIVTGFVGEFSQQIRVVGQASKPRALAYRNGITLLDVMIEVGGLGENASGNRAKVVRRIGKKQREIGVHLDDLLNDGDMSQNVTMMPGDVVIIPETWF
jgi:polysaccharide export outer membrane protein